MSSPDMLPPSHLPPMPDQLSVILRGPILPADVLNDPTVAPTEGDVLAVPLGNTAISVHGRPARLDAAAREILHILSLIPREQFISRMAIRDDFRASGGLAGETRSTNAQSVMIHRALLQVNKCLSDDAGNSYLMQAKRKVFTMYALSADLRYADPPSRQRPLDDTLDLRHQIAARAAGKLLSVTDIYRP